MNLGLTVIACAIVLISGCSSSAERSKYCADSLMKDSFVKDSIAKVMAAEEAKLTDTHTNTPADRKFIKTAELKFCVRNVLYATEKTEDLTAKYGGYMIYSNLVNRLENSERANISRDSILISKQIIVENQLQLRIPTQNLDSFVRSLKPLVTFLDYRIIKLNDVTLQYISNQKKTDRLQNYEKRQAQHIDSKSAKLHETSNAEDILLEHQNQADEIKLQSLSLDDQVKYCTVTIDIYQEPIIAKKVIADFNYVSYVKPGFGARVWDSVVQGWNILAEVVVFLVKIWGIAFLIIAIVFGIKYLSRWYKQIK